MRRGNRTHRGVITAAVSRKKKTRVTRARVIHTTRKIEKRQGRRRTKQTQCT